MTGYKLRVSSNFFQRILPQPLPFKNVEGKLINLIEKRSFIRGHLFRSYQTILDILANRSRVQQFSCWGKHPANVEK